MKKPTTAEDHYHDTGAQMNREYAEMYDTVGRQMAKLITGTDPGPLPTDFFDDKGGL